MYCLCTIVGNSEETLFFTYGHGHYLLTYINKYCFCLPSRSIYSLQDETEWVYEVGAVSLMKVLVIGNTYN